MAIDKKQTKKFQNLTVDYTKIIGKMSVSDRMSMLRNSEGQSLLSSLTPSQLAEMFPDYYKKQYPDVGKILKSISSPDFKGAKYDESQRTAFMDVDRRRIGAGERINYPKLEIKPKWIRELEKETGMTISDPGAKAKLDSEKKALLDELSKGKISADDPRFAFLKDISEQDLLKYGIKKQVDANGKASLERLPTTASTMTDDEISDKIRSEAKTSVSPRERAVLDLIAKREGSANPGVIFGDKGGVPGSGKYSKELGLDKRPLDDRSITEVLDLQKQLTRLTRRDGHGGGLGTSAVGTGQMIRETLLANLRALGIPESEWPNIKFDKNLQERLTLMNFKTSGIGDPNADPSTWNMRILGKQYESLDVSKGFKGITNAEMQSIAQASPTKPVEGTITAEAITKKRAELDRQEREKQETGIAEIIVPETPRGLDPKLAKELEKETPARKKDIIAMIEKSGKGDLTAGVNRLNEIYKQNPTLVQEGVFENKGKLAFESALIEGRAAQLNPYMQNALNKFQEFAPRGATITSTYRPPEHELERDKPGGPGAHSRGSAIDLRTRGKSAEELAETVQALKRAGYTKVVLKNNHIHAEVNPGQSFHISNAGKGNPTLDLRKAQEAASVVAFNEELPGNQKDRENQVATANVEPRTTATNIPTTPEQTNTQQPQANGQVTQSNTQVTQANTQPVNVYAEGGKQTLDAGEIKAMPIDSLKGDNSVVVDDKNKPLFTMNTKEEQAFYNPKTRQVDVQPLTKTDPNSIGEKKIQNTEAMMETDNPMAKEYKTPQLYTPETNLQVRSTDDSISMTDELFKDPSFKRAVAKTRFVDTGDAALGGHFGMANADLG